jgi:hypothetical protein
MRAVEQPLKSDVKDTDPMHFEKYAGGMFLELKSEASLQAMLKLIEISIKRGRSPFLGTSDRQFQDPKTSLSKAEEGFMTLLTGYNPKRRNNLSPLIHRDGKLWLPAIDAVLKKPELKPEHRTLLERTKGVIEKYCME